MSFVCGEPGSRDSRTSIVTRTRVLLGTSRGGRPNHVGARVSVSDVTLRWGHVQWVRVELDDDSDIVSVVMARKRIRTLCVSAALPLVVAGV